MNTARKIGIALIIMGIAIHFLVPEVYGWIVGAMWGAGIALVFLFGPKKVKE